MTIEIEAPEIERRMREAAAHSGLTVEEYLLQLLDAYLPSAAEPEGGPRSSDLETGSITPSPEALREYSRAARDLRRPPVVLSEEELERQIDEAVQGVRRRHKLRHTADA